LSPCGQCGWQCAVSSCYTQNATSLEVDILWPRWVARIGVTRSTPRRGLVHDPPRARALGSPLAKILSLGCVGSPKSLVVLGWLLDGADLGVCVFVEKETRTSSGHQTPLPVWGAVQAASCIVMSRASTKRILQDNSLARHWARDWRALLKECILGALGVRSVTSRPGPGS